MSWSCMIYCWTNTIMLEHCNTVRHLNDQHGFFFYVLICKVKKDCLLKGRSVKEKHAGKDLGWDCSTTLEGPVVSNRKTSLSNSKFIQITATVCSSPGNEHSALSFVRVSRRINVQGRMLPSEAGGREMSEDTWLFILATFSRVIFFMWVESQDSEVHIPRSSLGNQ